MRYFRLEREGGIRRNKKKKHTKEDPAEKHILNSIHSFVFIKHVMDLKPIP